MLDVLLFGLFVSALIGAGALKAAQYSPRPEDFEPRNNRLWLVAIFIQWLAIGLAAASGWLAAP